MSPASLVILGSVRKRENYSSVYKGGYLCRRKNGYNNYGIAKPTILYFIIAMHCRSSANMHCIRTQWMMSEYLITMSA